MTPPPLSVVVPSVRRDSVVAAVESVRAAVAHAGTHAQLLVAWQGEGAPPALPDGVEAVPVLPIGVAAARNAGLARAAADIVAYVDDDETVGLEWAAAVLRAFADPRVDAALGQVLPADGDGVPYCEIRIPAPRLLRGRRRAPWDLGTGGNMALRRAVLAALGGFDVRLGAGTPSRSGEDTDVIARLQEAGAVIALWPDMIAYHPRKTPAELHASRAPYGRGMGVLARRRRSAVLIVHFLAAAHWSLRAALGERSAHGVRELAETARGWAGGVLAADRWDAPVELGARAPEKIRSALGARALRGLPVARRGDLHLVYAAGADRVLHVRTGDPARRARGLAVQRSLDGQPGVPRVVAAVETAEAQWVVEARVPGDPAQPGDARVAAWFAALARRSGDSVREGGWWAREAGGLARLGGVVADALKVVGGLPAAPAHGAPRAEHVLVGDDGVAVINWEDAESDAPAGLDLIALALAAGEDVGTLLDGAAARLAEAGVPATAGPALVTVTLAHLIQAERRRAALLGAPPARPCLAPVLERWSSRLATAIAAAFNESPSAPF